MNVASPGSAGTPTNVGESVVGAGRGGTVTSPTCPMKVCASASPEDAAGQAAGLDGSVMSPAFPRKVASTCNRRVAVASGAVERSGDPQNAQNLCSTATTAAQVGQLGTVLGTSSRIMATSPLNGQ
jgi:hypothetical protein